MSAHIVEKAKGPGSAVPEKLPDPVVKTEDALAGVISLPAPDLEVVHILRYRQLQAEAEAREKKLLAELEEKQEMYYKKIEESFAVREKLLIEDLQAKHMAECRRLELVAADREHNLLEQLGVARRLLTVVVLGFVILVGAVLYYRAGLRETARPIPPPSGASGEAVAPLPAAALFPHLVAPEIAWTTAALNSAGQAGSKTVVAVNKAGNGGNFARGYSSGK